MTSSRFIEACRFAAMKHATMRRKAATGLVVPYVTHPLEVAQILIECGVSDEDILIAAVLHDTLEDTDAKEEDILFKFGERVLSLVKEVTDDKKLTKEQQRLAQVSLAPTKSYGGKLLKAADKTSNNRDLKRLPPPKYTIQDFRQYATHSREVVGALNVKGELPPQLLALFWQASQEVLDWATEAEFRAAQA
jgi:guanosine-3',5'-bis(diphosphate) 3'-pyrophosphohydrolase